MVSEAGTTTGKTPSRPGEQEVPRTSTYNGERFHLHQVVVVDADGEHDRRRERIVVGLEDGLKLASPDFEQKQEYPSDRVPESIEPQVADTGVPIFGY